MDPGGVLLDFGKHKGQALRELPANYLAFLCCYEHARVHGSDNVERVDRERDGLIDWLWENRADTIRAERQYARDRSLCLHCLRRLVPIGDSRANGKAHPDWEGRTLHKQCYKEILDD